MLPCLGKYPEYQYSGDAHTKQSGCKTALLDRSLKSCHVNSLLLFCGFSNKSCPLNIEHFQIALQTGANVRLPLLT